MGQYHIVVNLDKKQFIHPHDLGLGLKQWEHISGDASIPQALYILLTASPARGGGDLPETSITGSWVGDRVVVLGDYTQDSDLPSYPHFGSVYPDTGGPEWTNISNEVASAFATMFGLTLDGDGWKSRTVGSTI